MAWSPGYLVSSPEMFAEHMLTPQINICIELSHSPREVITKRIVTEQASLLALKKKPTVIILIIK